LLWYIVYRRRNVDRLHVGIGLLITLRVPIRLPIPIAIGLLIFPLVSMAMMMATPAMLVVTISER
jgi:uncharacterized membrane protein